MQAAAPMPPPPLPQHPPQHPPQQPALPWWQQLIQEQEAEELEEHQQVAPLPPGLLGQSWGFTGGNWSPQRQEPPPPPQEPEEHQVPPEAQPLTHPWNAPGYVVLSDDED